VGPRPQRDIGIQFAYVARSLKSQYNTAAFINIRGRLIFLDVRLPFALDVPPFMFHVH
jgi:hypothetical protein